MDQLKSPRLFTDNHANLQQRICSCWLLAHLDNFTRVYYTQNREVKLSIQLDKILYSAILPLYPFYMHNTQKPFPMLHKLCSELPSPIRYYHDNRIHVT
jgi:hypothetical protein